MTGHAPSRSSMTSRRCSACLSMFKAVVATWQLPPPDAALRLSAAAAAADDSRPCCCLCCSVTQPACLRLTAQIEKWSRAVPRAVTGERDNLRTLQDHLSRVAPPASKLWRCMRHPHTAEPTEIWPSQASAQTAHVCAQAQQKKDKENGVDKSAQPSSGDETARELAVAARDASRVLQNLSSEVRPARPCIGNSRHCVTGKCRLCCN